MINTEGMTVFHCVEELQEDLLDYVVIALIPSLVKDLGEQIAVAGVVHYDVRVIFFLQHAVERHDIGMSRGDLVEGNFANVSDTLSVRPLMMQKALHGVRVTRRADVNGTIHDAITSNAEYLNELESTVVDEGSHLGV